MLRLSRQICTNFPTGYSDPYCMMGIVATADASQLSDPGSGNSSPHLSKPILETTYPSSNPLATPSNTLPTSHPKMKPSSSLRNINESSCVVSNIAMSGALLLSTGTLSKLGGAGEGNNPPASGEQSGSEFENL